ncbi:hypothetical protein PF011_g25463 [Phytophthora fragariae]|uniref:Mnd1 HTH domain-containing protein n=1 Tax=Phytophthora fragariae TaxID=53985 RepID=A0A6A3DY65_9STRA|nr:hypothetical protein PF009_g27168 [Phytophthora fragariae]KAE8972926.1 hypothetical protein PF011_g25463 [Phytophthora fragariae]
MGRKGVSLQEKRERILRIYHESNDVFNLKKLEKLGSKAGIVQVDDALGYRHAEARYVGKMAIPSVVKSSASLAPAGPRGMLALDANEPPDGVVFRMLRRGNKGKVEARHLVPEVSSLAQHSHRQENAGKKEHSELKRLVLQNMERDDFINASRT